MAERRFRLVVTATDVTRGELAYFPWDYEGTYGLEPRGQLVVDAVRASMSIPFFFEPVILKGSDGISSTLVDGGVLANCPVDIFDRTDGRPPRWPTFGVRLLPRLPMDAAKILPIAGLFRHGPVALAADLAMTAIVGRDQAHLAKPWVKVRTIQVDTAGINPVDFGLSKAQATTLFENGQSAATRFVSEWDWNDNLATYRGQFSWPICRRRPSSSQTSGRPGQRVAAPPRWSARPSGALCGGPRRRGRSSG